MRSSRARPGEESRPGLGPGSRALADDALEVADDRPGRAPRPPRAADGLGRARSQPGDPPAGPQDGQPGRPTPSRGRSAMSPRRRPSSSTRRGPGRGRFVTRPPAPTSVGRTRSRCCCRPASPRTRDIPSSTCCRSPTGTDGRWGSGIAEARRIDLHNRHRVIFIAPAFDTTPWYGDNPLRPEVRQASYLTDVVIPFVDGAFPTVAEPAGRSVVRLQQVGPRCPELLPAAARPVRSGRRVRARPRPQPAPFPDLARRRLLRHEG